MHYVMSFFFVTYRRAHSGIWCQQCRAFEAAKWTLVSGLLGWWGFPWGPIYTMQALYVNAKGGEQPAHNNAVLLRIIGYQLFAKGELKEALNALTASLQLEPNVQATELYGYLRTQVFPDEIHGKTRFWKFVTAAPSLAVLILLALIGYVIVNRPSGYAARYQPPAALAPLPTNVSQNPPLMPISRTRTRANASVGRLADIVAARAPSCRNSHGGDDYSTGACAGSLEV